MSSTYMHWAKTSSQAKFNLATSGVGNVRLSELNVSFDDLEITNGGYGYRPLLEQLSSRYQVDTRSIVTAAGTSFANHLAIAALINPGDEVLFEQPTYEPMLAVARYLGADVRRFTRRFSNGFAIDTDELQNLASSRTRLIVLTNLHNPTAVLTDRQTLMQIREIARAVNARVLVDEVYMETLFEEQPRTAFHLGPQFVITSSLTKAFGLSGLRCGWIFAAPEIARRMWLLNDLFAATPVHAGERLSVVCLRQIEKLAARAKQLLDRNRELLSNFLDSREDIEIIRPEFGTIAFPRLRAGSADTLCDLLREKYDTSVVPGRFFEMPEHFRVGIAGDSDVLQEGLERLSSALDSLKS
ncbi:MAG: aminotransferase class I/II-fold pyridoxal phosphate-dependent enzyme [Pyrinomonadaceae bacterium]